MSICTGCPHRGPITLGSGHHISCLALRHLAMTDKTELMEIMLAAGSIDLLANGVPMVQVSQHGRSHGWASWPLDFDEIWVEGCMFKEAKKQEEV